MTGVVMTLNTHVIGLSALIYAHVHHTHTDTHAHAHTHTHTHTV